MTNKSLNENCRNKDVSYFFYSKNCLNLHNGNNIDECYLKALVLKANSYWCNNNTNRNVFNCHLHDNDFYKSELRINVCTKPLYGILGYMRQLNLSKVKNYSYNIKQSNNKLYNYIILDSFVHGFDFENFEKKMYFSNLNKFHWQTFAHEIGHFFKKTSTLY